MQNDKTESDAGNGTASTTRRALLLGGAAGLAGLVAEAVTSAQPASAQQGHPVLLGEDNTGATGRTGVLYVDNTAVGVLADGANHCGVQGKDSGSGPGFGVFGQSVNGTGVEGQTSAKGMSGVSGIDTSAGGGHGTYGRSVNGVGAYGESFAAGESGVYGNDKSQDGGYGVYGTSPRGWGIFGISGIGVGVYGTSGSAEGVYGASGTGVGVYGWTEWGTAVKAVNTQGGIALEVVGRVSFSQCSLATVPAGAKSVTVALSGVTTSSAVFATLQADAGAIAVANAVPADGSFTINLTAAPTSPVQVAWMVLN